MYRKLYLFLMMFSAQWCFAQEGAIISGALQLNANVFLRDSAINAYLQPQYKHQFFGGESWLNLNYSYQGFTAGIRYDMYLNSNLRNPNDSYSNQGIGRWFAKKQFEKFTAEVGYLYDQIGSGIIYRAYEQRPLFIDNSLLGASLKYKFNDQFSIKAFGGKQKNAFEIYPSNIKALVADGFFSFGREENQVNIIPGIGFTNKTLSDETMEESVVKSLQGYLEVDRFKPLYNSYAVTLYNTLNYKGFNWYVETAFKSRDVFFNPRAIKTEPNGRPNTIGKLEFKTGSVYYTSLSYAHGKLGVTFEAKRTQNFNVRIDPNLKLLRGFISYIPPMNRQNTYRLTARYSPATQDISEQAFQVDVRYKFNDKLSALVNTSHINTLEGEKLFREYLTEVIYKANSKTQVTGGLQILNYNQDIYEAKPTVPIVKAVTPYVDILYKISRKKSLRTEVQYMSTKEDYGSWLFALAEYGISPHWIFEVSGMYNTVPKKTEKILYPSVGAVYIKGSNRFQLRYVKQVEGVVCSGGICRLEPAFSGVRFSLNSNF